MHLYVQSPPDLFGHPEFLMTGFANASLLPGLLDLTDIEFHLIWDKDYSSIFLAGNLHRLH